MEKKQTTELTELQKGLIGGLSLLDLEIINIQMIILALNEQQTFQMALWLGKMFKSGKMPSQEIVMNEFLRLYRNEPNG